MPIPPPPERLSAGAPSPLPADAPGLEPAKPRVLVIDDEAAVCELLSLYLAEKGLEVATVRRVDEAKLLVEQGQFDLVVLDWRLDGADGLDLLQLCKALHPDIPVIIFTGAELGDGVLAGGLAREADEVVRKAGPLDTLSRAIFRHLGPRQAPPRNAA